MRTECLIQGCCISRSGSVHQAFFGSAPLFLFTKVRLNFVPEEQHPQLAMRGLVHGFGLHAHLVLIWRQFISAALLMPQVEEAAGRGPNHQQITVKILSVEVDVLTTPAFNVHIETTYIDEIRSVLAGHSKAKVPPKASVFFNDQLLVHRRDVIVTAVNHSRVILTEEDWVKHFLSRLSVQTARVQKVSSEDDVHVTEEEQDISTLPGSSSNIQPTTPRKLLIQLDQGEVSEVQLS